MLIYRITKTQYADRLVVSGGVACWNERGQHVIYTATNRILACLENVVHRSGEGLSDRFRGMVIDVSDVRRLKPFRLMRRLPIGSVFSGTIYASE